MGFPGGSDGKESVCNEGDPGLIPVLGRSSGEGNSTPSNILALRIIWTEESGGLQSMGLQRVRHDRVTNTQIHKLVTLASKALHDQVPFCLTSTLVDFSPYCFQKFLKCTKI